ncbi:MAG TPA: hypothetical protein VIO60_03455 [Rectinemataceae bacterium]
MTLKTRRRTYWALFGIAGFFLAAGLAASVVLAIRPDVAFFLVEHGIYRLHSLFGLKLPSQILSTVDCLLASAVVASILAAILRSFRKTVSTEILFFAFWLTSRAFEPLRLLHLILAIRGVADQGLIFFDKLYLGIGIFGYCSLFVSGLHAAGMRTERQFSIAVACAAIGGFLAAALPVNSGLWDWNLLFRVGYSRLVNGFTAAIVGMTVLNYLIAARVRGDKAFLFAAAGLAAAAIGAFFLGRDFSPLASLVAVSAILAGGGVFVQAMHSFYLWQ